MYEHCFDMHSMLSVCRIAGPSTRMEQSQQDLADKNRILVFTQPTYSSVGAIAYAVMYNSLPAEAIAKQLLS